MAKHKTVTHIPAVPPSPPAPAAPAPRLVAQLMTVATEALMLAVFFLGLVTAIGWTLSGIDRSRVTRLAPLPPRDWVCWTDRGRGVPRGRAPAVSTSVRTRQLLSRKVEPAGDETRKFQKSRKLLSPLSSLSHSCL
jgi:hypothetical protein